MEKVVNIRTCKSPYTRIDRQTIWGNPYIIGKHGDRNAVIAKYGNLMEERLEEDYDLWRKRLLSLRDKALGCWCHPKPCHGDVLIKYIRRVS